MAQPPLLANGEAGWRILPHLCPRFPPIPGLAPLAPFPPLCNHLFPAPQRPFSPRIKRVLKSSAAPQLEDGGAAFSESAGPLRQVVPLSENALAEF
jgi:hypothetical protein